MTDPDRRRKIEETVARLAMLDGISYELERENAAKDLGIRAGFLDMLVATARGEQKEPAGRKVVWPEWKPWPVAVDLGEVLSAICASLATYMVMREEDRLAAALWCAFTHVIAVFDHSPRLAIKSRILRSGKTRLLSILTHLVARPIAAENATPAALFRLIEAFQPTVMLDEADTFITPEHEEIRGIINSEFDRAGAVLRVEGEDQREVRVYATFSAMAIARIGSSAATIEDRSIALLLERKLTSDRLPRLTKVRRAELDVLHRQLLRWAEDNRELLAEAAEPGLPEPLNDRAADAWRPLLTIAELAGPDMAALARAAAVRLALENETEVQPRVVMALSDIRDWLMDDKRTEIFSQEIAAHLATLDMRPWPEYRRGQAITAAQIARLLTTIGLKSTTVRRGKEVAKGYPRETLDKVFARLLPYQTVTP